MLAENQSFTATLGEHFAQTPVLISGTATKWYASGLPKWASINATTGAITGTPTISGTTSISLTATDASNATSTAQLTLTVVNWSVLEIFVDVRNRKILTKADTKFALAKMTLKRDDRLPFRIVFVDGNNSFAIPSSFSVSVGLKSSYSSTEYLTFSASSSGIIDLSDAKVQALFTQNPDSIAALFEVRWEDAASSFRTVTLPAEIQNSVIRGNDYTAAAYLGADAINTAASTSAQVRAIGAPIFGPAKGNSYTIDISPGDKRISISYPAALGDLASVRYNQFNNSEVLDTFTKTSVQVSTSGNTASLYFVYTYTAAIPFEDFAIYTVTL